MDKKGVVDLIYKDLSYKIVGCFYEVYNRIGPGFKESIYQKALAIEFDVKKIPYEIEKRIPIKYRDNIVGYYTPDFIVDKKIIIEIKAIEIMSNLYEVQLYYYLKGTDDKLGYIVNFGGSKIDIRRRVYDKARNADTLITANIISGN